MLDAGIQNPAHCCILCQQRADCAGWNYCEGGEKQGGCRGGKGGLGGETGDRGPRSVARVRAARTSHPSEPTSPPAPTLPTHFSGDSNAGCWSPTTPMPYARGSCELRAFGAAVKDAGLASWTHGVKNCDGAPPLDTHVEIEL